VKKSCILVEPVLTLSSTASRFKALVPKPDENMSPDPGGTKYSKSKFGYVPTKNPGSLITI
jgi:hypothetical protein